MKFVILEQVFKKMENYRGVDRRRPSYVVDEEESSEINQLFFWSTKIHGVRQGYLSNIEKGKRLIQLYAKRPNPLTFEMIELTFQNESPKLGIELVGFDLASGTASLLSYGLANCDEATKKIQIEPINQLICLIGKHYRPQLNENCLFQNYSIARDCLNSMMALNSLVPDESLWEMNHSQYKVVGLYKIQL